MGKVDYVIGQHINIEDNEQPYKPSNNKSQSKPSKKKKEAIKNKTT